MESSRFDALTKSFSAPHTRRRLLGALAAGTLSLAGLRDAGARTCADRRSVCRENANCCTGFCGPKDRTGRRHCTCPDNGAVCEGTCCPDPAQVCGNRKTTTGVGVVPGCCLPPGTEIPGGCSEENKQLCCAFFFGSASQYTCDPDTNRCINPNTGF